MPICSVETVKTGRVIAPTAGFRDTIGSCAAPGTDRSCTAITCSSHRSYDTQLVHVEIAADAHITEQDAVRYLFAPYEPDNASSRQSSPSFRHTSHISLVEQLCCYLVKPAVQEVRILSGYPLSLLTVLTVLPHSAPSHYYNQHSC
jgi:hypothetical protein